MTITQSDYLAMLVRTRAKTLRPLPDVVERESDLHQQIADECRRRGWIALHGSMAHRTHRTIGEPDFIILTPGARTYLIECKSKKGKATQEQLAFMAWARDLGYIAEIVDSFEQFLEVVK